MLRVAWYATLVLATLTVLVLLWQFSVAVVMFLFSLVVSAAIRPLLEALQRRGLRKELTLGITFALVFSGLVAFFLVTTGPLIADLQQLTDDLLRAYEQVKVRWTFAENGLLNNLSSQLPRTQALYDALTGDGSSDALQVIFGAAEGTLEFMARLAIIMILSLYWSADQVRFERLWLSLLPVEGRARARQVWHQIESGVGAYLRREVTLSLLAGASLWCGYMLMGVNYPMLLALTGALARMVPWLGPLLVVGFPVLVGSSLGWWVGLAAAAYTLAILLLLETTIGANIFSRQRYSSLLLVIVVVALADSYGLLGAVLAPMLAVALQILFANLLPRSAHHLSATSANRLADLRAKMDRINRLARALDSPRASETANLVTRLERLLEKSLPEEQEYPAVDPGLDLSGRAYPSKQ